ncbi:MAG: methyltransferase [Thermoplasmatales archaeon]|nr:MAG: methyltransferase [Thermoplasmatales archaeon]
MRKKELEIILQKIPTYDDPSPTLEQYLTPAGIAADIIFIAYQFEDIKDKIVFDLGCGTGIFAIGASLTGAKKVVGFDVDKKIIDKAKNYADINNLSVEFLEKDIIDINETCDTILMNPPFGAQKSNIKADRRFIEKGFRISKVIYTLHLTKTISFIEKMVTSLNGEISYYKNYIFPIKHSYNFHEKKFVEYDVTLLRILTKR